MIPLSGCPLWQKLRRLKRFPFVYMKFAATNRSASTARSGLVGTAIAYWDCRQEHFQWGLPDRKKGKWGRAGRSRRISPRKSIAVAWARWRSCFWKAYWYLPYFRAITVTHVVLLPTRMSPQYPNEFPPTLIGSPQLRNWPKRTASFIPIP